MDYIFLKIWNLPPKQYGPLTAKFNLLSFIVITDILELIFVLLLIAFIYFMFYYLCYYSCPNFFFLHPHPPNPPTHFHSHSPHCCPYHGSFMYVLWLISSLSFNQSWPSSSLLTAVSLLHNSMPLVLFFSSVNFVH